MHRSSLPRLFSALALASLACAAQAREHNPLADLARDESPTDRLIVKYRDGVQPFATARGEAAIRVAGNRQGVSVRHLRAMSGGAHVMAISRAISPQEAEAMAQAISAGDPDILYAEPDHLLKPLMTPNDSYYSLQWSLSDATGGIRAPAAWDKASGSGVVVAVIDTGVRKHADFSANLLAGRDFVSTSFISNDGDGRDADAADPGDYVTAGYCSTGSAAANSSWHGTHVTGIVAATANNKTGVVGVAWGAKVLPLRALGRCGGYSSDIADAISWAAGNAVSGQPTNTTPAKVINLSLGGTAACGKTTQAAINAARAKGAVVVVAAGNEKANASTSSPANCTGVVSVAATTKAGGRASYSNYGTSVTLAAPGGDSGAAIASTWNTGTSTPGSDTYAYMAGTSMAAPAVSGVAALMLSANPKLTPDQVATLLKSSARAFPASCSGCGAGIVNAEAAVAAALAAK
ncbi:S8 family peptidase [Pelomonas sp. SE-A7]|uniref:S8 family peptidase n=1 Tax=Pelomonas sp. SE-A7 TaxID=3054953 RepID=UPI00259CA34D|nr:S8 family peptidase [Pelomonas sp. SE-A7]MDM4768513.1 S8 family peptidase [Pelomonas sp. SE-A7]